VSISKRGNSWRARYRGPDGRERNRSFKRKVDAQRWLLEQRGRANRGEWVDPAAARIAFADVANEWLAVGLHLKPKTRVSYGSLLRNQVLPRWGRIPVGQIRTDDVAEWINGMIRTGLSPSRTRQAVYVVSLVCDHAIRAGRLVRNPVRGVKLPRLTAAAERHFLTHDQVQQLAVAAGSYGTFVRTLAYTGLRWGEVTALRVRDVDLSRRRLDIRRAFSDVNGRLVEGAPKNHQARTVPLPLWLATQLKEQIDGRDPDELVFTTSAGYPLRMSNFRRHVWNQAVTAAGLVGLTPHGLRHTAASLYIAAGTPPKVVQRILGHGSIAVTLDLYGHLYPDEMDRWADRLGEIAEQMWPERGQSDDNDDDRPPSSASAGR
jgi:integrase